jgi:transposase
LLPDATHVQLETCSLDQAQSIVTLTLQTRQRRVACPTCGRRAKRVHSRYERTLADLPWGAYAVSIRLKIRRLFCDNAQCKRHIFAERVPGVAAPWARGVDPVRWTVCRLGCYGVLGHLGLVGDWR